MADTNLKRRRLIENEKILRDHNVAAKDAIKKYFNEEENLEGGAMGFFCECSDEACTEQLSMSIEEYEAIHERADRFLIATGHETPAVEKIVEQNDSWTVVEKFALAK